jgi:hypothetical protein
MNFFHLQVLNTNATRETSVSSSSSSSSSIPPMRYPHLLQLQTTSAMYEGSGEDLPTSGSTVPYLRQTHPYQNTTRPSTIELTSPNRDWSQPASTKLTTVASSVTVGSRQQPLPHAATNVAATTQPSVTVMRQKTASVQDVSTTVTTLDEAKRRQKLEAITEVTMGSRRPHAHKFVCVVMILVLRVVL